MKSILFSASAEVLILLLILSIASCQSDVEEPDVTFLIEPLYQMNTQYDTYANDTCTSSKIEYYIVSGYSDTKALELLIDSFVCMNRANDYGQHANYFVYIYEKTEVTNADNLSLNPRDFQRYSEDNDKLYEYIWRRGRFLAVAKWKRDEEVERRKTLSCLAQHENWWPVD